MTITMAPQLPLPFAEPASRRDDFVRSSANELALAWLERDDWPDRRLLVAGAAGSGKSHLLRAWAAETGAELLVGATLQWPMTLPSGRPVAIDDADTAPEPALLHVVNAAAEQRCRLVMTAATPPAGANASVPSVSGNVLWSDVESVAGIWIVALPDLASRLRATLAVWLGSADDGALADLFARLLADRQLTIAPPLQAWLLLRLPRTPGALREAAARLDTALLAAGRRPTRDIAAQVVAGLVVKGTGVAMDALPPFAP